MASPSRRWQEQATTYLWMARHYPELDASPAAAQAMYDYESRGLTLKAPWGNAYFVGKHWWDWQVSEWKAGLLDGTSTKHELLTDPTLPRAHVQRVLG